MQLSPRRNAMTLLSTVVAMLVGLTALVGTRAEVAAQADPKATTPAPQVTAAPQTRDTTPPFHPVVDTLAGLPRAMATRAELEATAAGKKGDLYEDELELVRNRLKYGDLQPGDRIALRVIGETTLTDTFVVKPTRTILLPNIGEIPVAGVLRSELNDYLRKQIGRYIRDPQLEATALVRVSMTGGIGKPGFYNLPADVLMSDAIMAAGGPRGGSGNSFGGGSGGDVGKTQVLRGNYVVVSKEQARDALQRGVSLDQLNIQSGDVIDVGKSSGGITGALRVMGMVSGAIFGVVALSRLF
jgi:protein involved in polysaccharide export with SLBB domain